MVERRDCGVASETGRSWLGRCPDNDHMFEDMLLFRAQFRFVLTRACAPKTNKRHLAEKWDESIQVKMIVKCRGFLSRHYTQAHIQWNSFIATSCLCKCLKGRMRMKIHEEQMGSGRTGLIWVIPVQIYFLKTWHTGTSLRLYFKYRFVLQHI